MMMHMFFHFGNKVIVLFQSWNVKTAGDALTCVKVFTCANFDDK
ncbi:hypothetical protein TrispH2_011913, partial [Trichoplax sp. H2]